MAEKHTIQRNLRGRIPYFSWSRLISLFFSENILLLDGIKNKKRQFLVKIMVFVLSRCILCTSGKKTQHSFFARSKNSPFISTENTFNQHKIRECSIFFVAIFRHLAYNYVQVSSRSAASKLGKHNILVGSLCTIISTATEASF